MINWIKSKFKRQDTAKDFDVKKEQTSDNKSSNNKTTNKTSKAIYKVVIKEKFGIGTTTLKTIDCERYLDDQDSVVYLLNFAEKFMELFPQDENDFEKLSKKEIEAKLIIARKDLKSEQKNKDPNINVKNLLYNVMKLEAKLRAVEYNKDSPYMTIDENGIKSFVFLREGSNFFPFKWDTDTKTIYVASEHKKKKAGIARRNKQIKYSKFKNVIEGSVMFMMIINVVLAAGLGFTAYKFFGKFDESAIVEAQNFCVQKGAEWTIITEKNAKATQSILEQIQQNKLIQNNFVEDFVAKEIGQ